MMLTAAGVRAKYRWIDIAGDGEGCAVSRCFTRRRPTKEDLFHGKCRGKTILSGKEKLRQ